MVHITTTLCRTQPPRDWWDLGEISVLRDLLYARKGTFPTDFSFFFYYLLTIFWNNFFGKISEFRDFINVVNIFFFKIGGKYALSCILLGAVGIGGLLEQKCKLS